MKLTTTFTRLTGAALLLGLAMPAVAQHKYNSDTWHRSKYLEVSFTKGKLELQDADEWVEKYAKLGKNKGGVTIKYGRTYYLKPTPNKSLMRFGIDATFVNLRWSQWKNVTSWYDRKWLTTNDGQSKLNEGNIHSYDANGVHRDEPWQQDWKYLSDGFTPVTDPVQFKENITGPAGPLMTGNVHFFQLGVQVGPSFTINPVELMNVCAYYRFSPCVSAILDKSGNTHSNYGFGAYFNWGFTVSRGIISIGFDGYRGHSNLKLAGKYEDFVNAGNQDPCKINPGAGDYIEQPGGNYTVDNNGIGTQVDAGTGTHVSNYKFDQCKGNNDPFIINKVSDYSSSDKAAEWKPKQKFYDHGFNVMIGFRFHHIKGW